MIEIEKVIEKHFKDEKVIFFHQSDRHLMEEPESYLRYKLVRDSVWLYFGSDNGELLILVTENAERFETLIKSIIL